MKIVIIKYRYLNLVYDRKNDRILGVDQGIDRDKYRNYHLKETYTRRSSGHRLFALNAQDGKLLASIETKDVPISLLLDEDSERIYVTNRGGIRVEKGVGSLSVFESKTLAHLQTLPLLPHPNSLALDSKAHALFVTVKNDGATAKANNNESVVRIPLH